MSAIWRCNVMVLVIDQTEMIWFLFKLRPPQLSQALLEVRSSKLQNYFTVLCTSWRECFNIFSSSRYQLIIIDHGGHQQNRVLQLDLWYSHWGKNLKMWIIKQNYENIHWNNDIILIFQSSIINDPSGEYIALLTFFNFFNPVWLNFWPTWQSLLWNLTWFSSSDYLPYIQREPDNFANMEHLLNTQTFNLVSNISLRYWFKTPNCI